MAEQLTEAETIRDAVRERYAAAAGQARSSDAACCGPESSCGGDAAHAREGFGVDLYGDAHGADVPQGARLASLGCGNPTAVAELCKGETVLDLGDVPTHVVNA